MPPSPTELLAKSPRGTKRLLLAQHLLDTEQAASALFRTGTRWAASFLRFFKVPPAEHARFLLCLRVAALFHDIGKANQGFLDMVHRRGDQSVRHEHLSALLLAHEPIDRWLAGCTALDRDAVLAAVLCHHLKAADRHESPYRVLQPKLASTALYFTDAQVVGTLGRVAELAGLPAFQGEIPRVFNQKALGWEHAIDALLEQRAPAFARAIAKDASRRGLSLALKAGLIAADSVASASFREDLDLERWVDEVAHRPALEPDAVERDVLQPRIEQIVASRGSFAYHAFQDGIASVGRRGLVLAACGGGKTLAAWRWADAVARGEPIGRVIFLYPTRGTATEGFRDYVGHAPEGDAALMHGTADFELRGMEQNPPESLRGKTIEQDEAEARLFALGQWPKRYFSATVDQFLSCMEHGYGGMCMLPALADAAVIFDEVHAYDDRMWGALLDFLRNFDVPALCMTATLPPARARELGALLTTYPSEQDRKDLEDLERAEHRQRYRLRRVADAPEALDLVASHVAAGERVLWVVNTVARCQELAATLRSRFGAEVLVYHSRYRLVDRQRQHAAVVAAFQGASDRGVIAVTTQVCEMSLDLDADVLVTEVAPVASLVQRFGRANRKDPPRRGDSFRAALYVYDAPDHRPYEKDELGKASAFITALAGGDVSQRDLAVRLVEFARGGRLAAEDASSLLTGGFFAEPGALRDNDDVTSAALLDQDVEEYKRCERSRDPMRAGLVLSAPRRQTRPSEDAGLPAHLRIARAANYHASIGLAADPAYLPSPGEP